MHSHFEKYFIFNYVYMYVVVCMHMWAPAQDRRGCLVTLTWNYSSGRDWGLPNLGPLEEHCGLWAAEPPFWAHTFYFHATISLEHFLNSDLCFPRSLVATILVSVSVASFSRFDTLREPHETDVIWRLFSKAPALGNLGHHLESTRNVGI